MPDVSYAGLPRGTATFLAELEANNSRDWFDAHQADYHVFWRDAGLDLIAALSGPCAALVPPLMAVPRLNASLRRIHRDVRFSRDKRPYDARMHLILSTGAAFNKVPGVHLVIGPNSLGFGAGAYGLPPDGLARFRSDMTMPAARARVLDAIEQARAVGAVLDPPDLARVPKPFDPQPDWAHLFRRKSVIMRGSLADVPNWVFTPQATDRLMTIVAALNPLAQALVPYL
jgi:uncharacterized protein (TIGR02453 family)